MLIFENGKSAIDFSKVIRRLEGHTVLQELTLLQRKKNEELEKTARNNKILPIQLGLLPSELNANPLSVLLVENADLLFFPKWLFEILFEKRMLTFIVGLK